MNIFFRLLFIFSLILLNFLKMDDARLTVVTSEPLEFLLNYYQQVRNKNPPSDSDSAMIDASNRIQICENIYNSGVFRSNNLKYDPIDLREEHAEMEQTENPDLHSHFHEVLRLHGDLDSDNTNEFRLHHFTFENFIVDGLELTKVQLDIDEYVFLCFLKETNSNKIISYYVSKSYNLLHDQRFIFLKTVPHYLFSRVLLAEKSSKAYMKPEFNVELHYLELRKHHEVAQTLELDPVCKFNSGELQDDQSFRLCAIVLGSSNFKDRVVYPRRSFHNAWVCYKNEISFKTIEALEVAAGKLYYERMIRCYVTLVDGNDFIFYISRAYNPHQVFVYSQSPANGDIHLDIMSTDVNIVYELYNFGNVEI